MKENNMHTCLIFLEICVCCVGILSRRCYGADYWYEACGPRKCANGPNISFPFYIQGQQDAYCGYRSDFMVNCSPHGFPVIPKLSGNEYVVEDIFYETQSFRVYNSAAFSSNDSSCIPRFRNTTFPEWRFGFADNVTMLNLFSNCTDSLSRNLSGNMVFCDVNDRDSRVLALYEKDGNITNAVENCETNLVAPVEDDGNLGMENLTEVLRRGFVLNWTASDCSECRGSGGYCGFNETNRQFKCFCPDRPHASRCNPGAEKPRLTLILATAISVSGLVLCLLISLILWRCKRRLKTDLLSRNISSDPYSKSDIEQGSFHFNIPIFSYKELVEATNNFDSSKELGDGGFGTVYYGKLHDGREVAIKRLYERSRRRVEQFMNEIKILTNLRHKNLVSLYGCTSRRSKELLLVYEYVPNGTIADHLHGEKAGEAPLTWPIRMKIAIETASALAYLHKSDIIHRDVKTNNILLDSNFCVKVADFGLSRLFPNDVTHVSTAPQGTPGYVDPDYHQCYHLTDKSDVYSFGVVLIELVSSMPAVDISRHTSEINLANLAVNRIQRRAFDELIDSSIGYESDVEVTRMTTSVAELAFQCLQLEKDMRPSMDEVLDSLMHIQGGDELDFETKNEANDSISVTGKITPSPETDDSVLSKKANDSISVTGKITPSPGTDDIVLLKNKRFQSSPNAVTDMLVSSSTTRSSYHKSLEI